MMETTERQRTRAGAGGIMKRILHRIGICRLFLGHHTMELRGIGMYNTGVKREYSHSRSLDHETMKELLARY